MTTKFIYSIDSLSENKLTIESLKEQIANLLKSGILKLGYIDAEYLLIDANADQQNWGAMGANIHIINLEAHVLLEMEHNLFGFNLDDSDKTVEIVPYIDFKSSKLKAVYKVAHRYRNFENDEDHYDPTKVIFHFALMTNIDTVNNTVTFDSHIESQAKAFLGEDTWGNNEYGELPLVGAFADFSDITKSLSCKSPLSLLDECTKDWVLANKERLTNMISNSFIINVQ